MVRVQLPPMTPLDLQNFSNLEISPKPPKNGFADGSSTSTPPMNRFVGDFSTSTPRVGQNSSACCDGDFTPGTAKAINAHFQRHHIITRSTWRDLFFSENLSKCGLSMDGEWNVVRLPRVRLIPNKIKNLSTPSHGWTLGRRACFSSIHAGAHSAGYTLRERKNLLEILGNKALSKKTKANRVVKFATQTKEMLVKGKLRLNSISSPVGERVAYGNNANFTHIPGYTQVHHIIPLEVFNDKTGLPNKNKNLKFFGRALKFLGFGNRNAAENLCGLPIAAHLADEVALLKTPTSELRVGGRSIHNGSHPMYTEMIKNCLRGIFGRLDEKISNEELSLDRVAEARENAAEEVSKLISNTKNGLLSGSIKLI
jgi:hypothetical protein